MIKSLIALLLALLFIACSQDEKVPNIEPKLVVGKSLADLHLKDQRDVVHGLDSDTYRVIFAFAKDAAHTCNDFFNTKEADYLQQHHAQFIADVSSAPSIIRTLFILPGLKDFKHTVLLLDDTAQAAPYRVGIDTEKIVVVYVINGTISEIRTLQTTDELKKMLEDDSPLSFIAPVMNEVLSKFK